jgi:hypothetical protein
MRAETAGAQPPFLSALVALMVETAALGLAFGSKHYWTFDEFRIHKHLLAYVLHIGAALLVSLAFGRAPALAQVPCPRRGTRATLVPLTRRGRSTRVIGHALSPFAFAVALLFPVLGTVAMSVVALLRRFRPVSEDIKRSRRRSAVVPASHMQTARSFRSSAHRIRPFVELVSSQEREDDAMVAAIENVAVLEEHTAAHLLRHALASKIPETRLYAADRLAKIEEKVGHQLQIALKAHEKYPAEPEIQRRVADARLRYGAISLPEDPLTRFHLTEAIRFYKQCLPQLPPPQQTSCRARLALACLRAGEASEACRYYSELVDAGTKDEQIIGGCVEACFACGSYEKLRRYLTIGRERCPNSRHLREVAQLWL